MIQYTTPTIHIAAHGADLTPFTVRVTIKQGSAKVSVDASGLSYDADTDTTSMQVPLTQEQTGIFRKGSASIQLNWFDGTGYRDATVEKPITVENNLIQEVI